MPIIAAVAGVVSAVAGAVTPPPPPPPPPQSEPGSNDKIPDLNSFNSVG